MLLEGYITCELIDLQEVKGRLGIELNILGLHRVYAALIVCLDDGLSRGPAHETDNVFQANNSS